MLYRELDASSFRHWDLSRFSTAPLSGCTQLYISLATKFCIVTPNGLSTFIAIITHAYKMRIHSQATSRKLCRIAVATEYWENMGTAG
jgi:hypothetical protein